jgi:hypothetical protein
MIRWSVIAAGVAIIAGAAFVMGSSVPPRPPTKLPETQELKACATLGQNTGYFNMSKVMSEYQRAQSAVSRIGAQKDRMLANLAGLRAMYNDLPHQPRPVPAPQHLPPGIKLVGPDPLSPEAILLDRRIQDLELEIAKLTTNQASKVIVELYDELHSTVVELAHEHNLVAVLAFPDARSPEEMDSPMIKELKLKPPAAQSFYLDSVADYTDELIERLNAKTAHNGRK